MKHLILAARRFAIGTALMLVLLPAAPFVAHADGPPWYSETSYDWYNTYDTYAPSYDDGWYSDTSYDYYNTYDVYGSQDGWYTDTSYDYYNTYDVYGSNDWYTDTSYDYYNTYDVYGSSGWYTDTSYDYYNTYDVYQPNYSYSQPYYSYTPSSSYYVYDTYSYTPSYSYTPPRNNRPNYDDVECDLEASDYSVEEGDRITLRYETDGDVDDANLSGFGSVNPDGGSKQVTMNSTRTYTLNVSGRGGSDSCSVTIRVEDDEDDFRCELDASDKNIEEGDDVTLRWNIDGDVEDARINQGIGRVDEDGGSLRVRPRSDTTYVLTIEDEDGDEEECDVRINVDDDNDDLPPPPDEPIVYLSQLPYTGTGMDSGMTMAYWLAIVAGAAVAGYYFFFRLMPFALAKAAMEGEETPVTDAPIVDAPVTPENVTRQDVRAFVSAIASRDAESARDFARSMGPALLSETAVVLEDVRNARASGSVADTSVTSMTEGMSDATLDTLVTALADAKDADAAIDAATA